MVKQSIRELNSIPRHRQRSPAFVPIKYDYFYDWQSFENIFFSDESGIVNWIIKYLYKALIFRMIYSEASI